MGRRKKENTIPIPPKKKDDKEITYAPCLNEVFDDLTQIRGVRYGSVLSEYRRFTMEKNRKPIETARFNTACEIADRLHIADPRQITDTLDPAGYATFFMVYETHINNESEMKFTVSCALFISFLQAKALYKKRIEELKAEKPVFDRSANVISEFKFSNDEIVRLEISVGSMTYREIASPTVIFVLRHRGNDLLIRPVEVILSKNKKDFLWSSAFAAIYADPEIKSEDVLETGYLFDVPFSILDGKNQFAGKPAPNVYASFSFEKEVTPEELNAFYDEIREIGLSGFRKEIGETIPELQSEITPHDQNIIQRIFKLGDDRNVYAYYENEDGEPIGFRYEIIE